MSLHGLLRDVEWDLDNLLEVILPPSSIVDAIYLSDGVLDLVRVGSDDERCISEC